MYNEKVEEFLATPTVITNNYQGLDTYGLVEDQQVFIKSRSAIYMIGQNNKSKTFTHKDYDRWQQLISAQFNDNVTGYIYNMSTIAIVLKNLSKPVEIYRSFTNGFHFNVGLIPTSPTKFITAAWIGSTVKLLQFEVDPEIYLYTDCLVEDE